MSQLDYQAAVDYILSFADYERASRAAVIFDTSRIEAILGRLGQPHLAAKSVHIAGTKGKGKHRSHDRLCPDCLRLQDWVIHFASPPQLHGEDSDRRDTHSRKRNSPPWFRSSGPILMISTSLAFTVS